MKKLKALKPFVAFAGLGAALCMLGFGAAPLQAQPFPTKPVRIVVPAGPGSAVDTVVRDLVPGLTELFGQQVVVDNKPGANSAIGAREVARAPADGHTLLHGNVNNALNDLLSTNPCCKLGEALLPVTRMTATPLVMVVHPSVPANNLKEFLALAKSQPDRITQASGGNGSITHLLGEMMNYTAGIKLRDVPYKAIGAELPDLLAGHVMVAYLAPVVVAQHIKLGKLRALGMAGSKRVAIISEVPTMAEAGLSGVEASGWNGLFVPAGTPVSIINRIQADVAKVLQSPAYKAQAASVGSELGGESPQEFAAFIRAEMAKWGRLIKDANIKTE